MTDPKIDISVALEVEEDWPVADIAYAGDHWASITFNGGELAITIYAQSAAATPIPLDAAIESLERAKQQLLDVVGEDRPR